MTSTCEVCGVLLVDPVSAILHYERIGAPSSCDRRVARLGPYRPDDDHVVVSLGVGIDIRNRRRRSVVEVEQVAR